MPHSGSGANQPGSTQTVAANGTCIVYVNPKGWASTCKFFTANFTHVKRRLSAGDVVHLVVRMYELGVENGTPG